MRIIVIKSFTDPNKEYMVRVLDTGEWRCNCPSFILRRAGSEICKHILKARENEKNTSNSNTYKDSMAYYSDDMVLQTISC